MRRLLAEGEARRGARTGGDGDVPQAVFDAYHRWYYESGVWRTTTFLGVPCRKSVSDLWNYQEIIVALQPGVVVEFGTYCGGSALFFSTVLAAIRPDSRVLTVDVDPQHVADLVRADPRIDVLTASSTDPPVEARVRALRDEHEGPMFVVLDSLHDKDHVLAELELLRRLLEPGDYVVVEDTNINGHPVEAGWGDGPMEALAAYETEFPGDFEHDRDREAKFGFTFAPRGFLIRRPPG